MGKTIRTALILCMVPALLSAETPQAAPPAAPPQTVAPVPLNPPQDQILAPPPSSLITVEARNMDVSDALRILSAKTPYSMVVGRNVRGQVTISLKNVEFWEALGMILETQDLAYAREGQTINVMTSQDFEKIYGAPFNGSAQVKVVQLQYANAEPAKKLLEPLKSRLGKILVDDKTNSLILVDSSQQLAVYEKLLKELDVPSETRTFKLNYASVEDILPKISSLVSKEFGNIQGDKRSNSIVVTDNPAHIRQIAALVAAFDEKHKAVLIEAKIVQVVLNNQFQWGVNWERAFHYQRNQQSGYSGVVVGNTQLLPLQSVTQNLATGQQITAPGITANITALSGLQFEGALNFLETCGKTKILSAPRVVALNNQEAKILVGTKEAFVTSTVVSPGGGGPVTTTESVNFVDVGVKLYVTPSIGDDGYITLKIKPEVSSVDSTLRTAQGNSIPIVRLSEAETSLVVKDGVTVLIGGLMEDKKVNSKSGVPFLSRIPILGLPFRSQDDATQKTELAIFLTPHLTSGDVVAPESEFLQDRDMTPAPKGKKKK